MIATCRVGDEQEGGRTESLLVLRALPVMPRPPPGHTKQTLPVLPPCISPPKALLVALPSLLTRQTVFRLVRRDRQEAGFVVCRTYSHRQTRMAARAEELVSHRKIGSREDGRETNTARYP